MRLCNTLLDWLCTDILWVWIKQLFSLACNWIGRVDLSRGVLAWCWHALVEIVRLVLNLIVE